jgi:hypothetical protein
VAYKVAPTNKSPAPMSKTISVTLGISETTRFGCSGTLTGLPTWSIISSAEAEEGIEMIKVKRRMTIFCIKLILNSIID